MHLGSLSTPLGWMNVEASDWSVFAVYFTPHPHVQQSDHPLVLETKSQLAQYFDGTLKTFRLPLDPPGTVFQRQVWDEVSRIPFGQTLTYARLARQVGAAQSVRAVAAANAANPVAILIPCHRVIGSNGQLTGYAWGLERKEKLLHHESQQEQLRLF